jgi:hypothetical protein
MSPTHPFASAAALERRFADGLLAMLEQHRGLGVYILVLANAAYDDALWTGLAPALAQRHAELAEAITATLRRGGTLAEPDDDVLVFLKLNTIGFERIGRLACKRAGPWQLMFNPLRALRPPRSSGMTFCGLMRAFDPSGFHFNKPFLAREVLWQGEVAGKGAHLFYNKFPFARLHGLLVPEPLRELPQYLDAGLHRWAWDVCAQTDIADFCLGYNSYGAGASVNHLHLQSFVQTLPVHDARFSHNGGTEAYPLPCLRLTDADDAWAAIADLHRAETPYNLVYGKGAMHLIARVAQDSDALDADTRAYGWSEMAGAVTLFTREANERLDAAAFEAALARFAPAPQASLVR